MCFNLAKLLIFFLNKIFSSSRLLLKRKSFSSTKKGFTDCCWWNAQIFNSYMNNDTNSKHIKNLVNCTIFRCIHRTMSRKRECIKENLFVFAYEKLHKHSYALHNTCIVDVHPKFMDFFCHQHKKSFKALVTQTCFEWVQTCILLYPFFFFCGFIFKNLLLMKMFTSF